MQRADIHGKDLKNFLPDQWHYIIKRMNNGKTALS